LSAKLTVDEFWNAAQHSEGLFDPDSLVDLPEPVFRYLNHAIAPDTSLAYAVRLQMRGEIKLREWAPFQAEQVIISERGMIWSAKTRVNGLPVSGSDRLIDGEGSMRWRLFGILPVMSASGSDITRSASGRLQGEFVWLPSVFTRPEVEWAAPDKELITAKIAVAGNIESMTILLDENGSPKELSLPRWGNPDGGAFSSHTFGAVFEEEQSFGGFTIPTKLQVGWHFGSDRFETEGKFFRCTVDDVTYR
jgi:hypothetical protein